MSLPPSIDYLPPVPPHRPLPTSRATWELDPSRAAVLVHDLQRYFVRPYAPQCVALTEALRRTAEILTAARAAGVPVFYTAQRGDQDQVARGLQRDLWGPGMRDRAEHTEILDAVRPVEGETVLVKHRYSAFASSDLAQRLDAAGRDHLVITGVYAHIGITATALEAFQREIHPFVVADAVADFGADEHALALRQIASCSGVVLPAAAVLTALAGRGESATATGPSGDTVLRDALAVHLDEEMLALAFGDAETDLFTLGLDSLRAFEVLDALVEAGVDVDFGDFTRRPTVGHLREQLAAAERDEAVLAARAG